MAAVYLETSFVSACVTSRSDPASPYRREASLQWWQAQRGNHELFVSAEVIKELSHPRFPSSRQALEHIKDIGLLDMDESVLGLAKILVQEKVMPSPTQGDAIHVGAACVHRMDYLLTWNVRHLANPNKLQHLTTICLRLALTPPRIVTPDLLWEE